MIRLFSARDALGPDQVLARPRFNIRPTERILAAHLDEDGERALSAFRWGFLPRWAKSKLDGPPLINARGESVAEKPAFKSSFAARRCLVPADGFFEWRASPAQGGGKSKLIKQPYWIYPALDQDRPLVFGGVWRGWRGADGAESSSLAIVTTAANTAMASLHDRLPLRIAPEDFAQWLGEEGEPEALIEPPANAFYAHHPVSRRINRGGRDAPDDPALLEPVDPADENGPVAESDAQGTLF